MSLQPQRSILYFLVESSERSALHATSLLKSTYLKISAIVELEKALATILQHWTINSEIANILVVSVETYSTHDSPCSFAPISKIAASVWSTEKQYCFRR
jgi:hypothetical protein